jgi:hypothetical protein
LQHRLRTIRSLWCRVEPCVWRMLRKKLYMWYKCCYAFHQLQYLVLTNILSIATASSYFCFCTSQWDTASMSRDGNPHTLSLHACHMLTVRKTLPDVHFKDLPQPWKNFSFLINRQALLYIGVKLLKNVVRIEIVQTEHKIPIWKSPGGYGTDNLIQNSVRLYHYSTYEPVQHILAYSVHTVYMHFCTVYW